MLRDVAHAQREIVERVDTLEESTKQFGTEPKRREGEGVGEKGRSERRGKRQITNNVTPKRESAVSNLEATVTHAW